MAREWLYGRQPALECLRAQRRQGFRLLTAKGLRSDPLVTELQALAQQRRLETNVVENRTLNELTGSGNHQGVALEVGDYPYAELEAVLGQAPGDPLLLLLDHIQDPQNLGALLRTADAAGVDAVLIPKDRAVDVTPAVVRASAGAAEHMAVCPVVNLHQSMRSLKERNIWLAGLEGLPEAKLYTAADLRGPLGLVIGSEGEGLGRLVRETCDFLIRLPMHGRVGSLNASAAGAVALYEILRQRGLKT